MKTVRNLTEKQEKFVRLVVEGKPKAEAYREVYNTQAAPAIVRRKASEELKKPHVAARYQYMLDEARAQAAAGSIMKGADILAELSHIARGDKEYEDYVYDGDTGRDVELLRRPAIAARLKALELLGRSEALFTDRVRNEDQSIDVNITVTDTVSGNEA